MTSPDIQTLSSMRADDGSYALLDVRAPAGLTLPPHVPTRGAATLLVLEGRVGVVLDGERRELGPAGCAFLAAGVPRRVEVLADARVLCLTAPAGLELLAGQLAPAGLDPDDVAALLSAAGVSLLPRRWGAAA